MQVTPTSKSGIESNKSQLRPDQNDPESKVLLFGIRSNYGSPTTAHTPTPPIYPLGILQISFHTSGHKVPKKQKEEERKKRKRGKIRKLN